MKSRGLVRSSESTGMIYWRCYVGLSGGTPRMGVRTKVLSTLGFSHLTRNSAQRGGVCTATELGNLKVTPCPGSHDPRTYLFFSKELKSRVPTSSWLSLWKGDPMRLLGNSKELRGWGGVGGRDTAQWGSHPSQIHLGSGTGKGTWFADLSQPGSCGLDSVFSDPGASFPALHSSDPPMSLSKTSSGLGLSYWPPPSPEEREALTCGGKLI